MTLAASKAKVENANYPRLLLWQQQSNLYNTALYLDSLANASNALINNVNPVAEDNYIG